MEVKYRKRTCLREDCTDLDARLPFDSPAPYYAGMLYQPILGVLDPGPAAALEDECEAWAEDQGQVPETLTPVICTRYIVKCALSPCVSESLYGYTRCVCIVFCSALYTTQNVFGPRGAEPLLSP